MKGRTLNSGYANWIRQMAEATGKCRREKRRCMQTIDMVLSTRNLTEACTEVVKNKGAGGIDNMSVKQLKPHLDKHREELCCFIRKGMYIPQSIRGKEISKRKGRKRMLGIPTVVDRMLQQAVLRVIMPQFEYMFSEYSYGFRPQRNTQQAVLKSLDYINSGYQHIVDIDLKGFFDEIDHCLLRLCSYLSKGGKRPVSVNGGEKPLEAIKSQAKEGNPENNSHDFR